MRNHILEKENKSLADLVTESFNKLDALTGRLAEYRMEAPVLRKDLMLVCPSYHKGVEFNKFMCMVLDSM
jgi:hypothetical protein